MTLEPAITPLPSLKVSQLLYVLNISGHLEILSVCLPYREAIDGGLMALRRVIPGGDTFMNLGLEMVRLSL